MDVVTAGSGENYRVVRVYLRGYNGLAWGCRFVQQMEQNGYDGSTFPASCVMIPAWTATPWNASATTS